MFKKSEFRNVTFYNLIKVALPRNDFKVAYLLFSYCVLYFNLIFHGSHCLDYREIWMAGANGTGIGQFKIPHSVTVDPVGRVKNKERIFSSSNRLVYMYLSKTNCISFLIELL